MSGRRRDIIWDGFKIKSGNPGKPGCFVTCNKCDATMAGLVSRMRDHYEKKHGGNIGGGNYGDEEELSEAYSEELGREKDPVDDVTMEVIIDDDHDGATSVAESRSQGQGSSSASVAKQTTTRVSQSVLHGVKHIPEKRVAPDLPVSELEQKSKKTEKAHQSSKLDSFVIKTTKKQKEDLDIQIARCIYATNSAFSIVEHPEFKKMAESLRPGYSPPSRHDVSGPLLKNVYESVDKEVVEKLENKTVCMSIDGWSNIRNEPIVCVSVSDVQGQVHLIDTVDTGAYAHTADYLTELCGNAIKKCKEKYHCDVRSFVTDNAANMRKMRQQLAQTEGLNVITYGCSAHILNLLAQDIQIVGVKEHVKHVMKYFRNHHFPGAKYKDAGGKALVLPQDVRWNTMADCLASYIENWPIMLKVCEENRTAIDKEIIDKVSNVGIKRNAEDLLKRLKIISVALDKVQRDTCTISEATEIWITLVQDLEELNIDYVTEKAKQRFKMAITNEHLLANILDPRFKGEKLTADQINEAMSECNTFWPEALPTIIKYQANASPFLPYMFSPLVLDNTLPSTWWLSLGNRIDNSILDLIIQLHTAIASSAGIERLFSTFGFVHSKIRNRLGVEKAAKLVAIFKHLNNSQTQSTR